MLRAGAWVVRATITPLKPALRRTAMNPAELSVFLETLVRHEVQQSLMI